MLAVGHDATHLGQVRPWVGLLDRAIALAKGANASHLHPATRTAFRGFNTQEPIHHSF